VIAVFQAITKRGTTGWTALISNVNFIMPTVSPTDRIFILAGAGVSAENGIPTFPGVGGLWRNYRIEEVASPEAMKSKSNVRREPPTRR
jgi:NAD-dependent SIR2 family protein deacetylase